MECSRGCSGEIKGSSLAEIPASLPVPQKWGCWPFLPYGEVPNLGGTLGGHALDTAAALDVAAVWPPCPTWQMDKKRWQQAVPRGWTPAGISLWKRCAGLEGGLECPSLGVSPLTGDKVGMRHSLVSVALGFSVLSEFPLHRPLWQSFSTLESIVAPREGPGRAL